MTKYLQTQISDAEIDELANGAEIELSAVDTEGEEYLVYVESE